tara:strand:- start:204 stop:380 length:177 start_codon:yes stop_codon:yes gene_type:complete
MKQAIILAFRQVYEDEEPLEPIEYLENISRVDLMRIGTTFLGFISKTNIGNNENYPSK